MRLYCLLLVVLTVILANICSAGQATVTGGYEWRYWGHDAGGMRYSPLAQIKRSNVNRLVRAWTYHTGETSDTIFSTQSGGPPALETTPLVIDRGLPHPMMFFTTRAGHVVAIDPETAQRFWEFDPRLGQGSRPARAALDQPPHSALIRFPASGAAGKQSSHYGENRGLAFWSSNDSRNAACNSRLFLATFDGRLIALDAITGTPCRDFGSDGEIDLRRDAGERWPDQFYGVTSPAVVYRNVVIVGSEVPESPSRGPSGDVRAFDVHTGKLVWRFHTVPHPGETGHDTWHGDDWRDRTGANVWSIMSVDQRRGLVFLPLGSASYDFYGADRKGKDLFANSLVALDAATGKLRWYFQLVHHDLWDWDLPAQPALVDLRRGGTTIPAVVQVTKMGLVYVFNRRNGHPLFPIEERPVPRSTVPGEETWPTQPFPLAPPPLSRTSITRVDLNDATSEIASYCSELYHSVVHGHIFSPMGERLTLVWPGTLGGGTWSGGSFDPTSGYFYVNTNETGAVGRITKQPSGSEPPYRRTSPWGEYARFWTEDHIPCAKPPWGTLSAIDLRSGKIAWKVPLGTIDRMQRYFKADTGAPNLGGSIVTAGGLVFIAGTDDSRFRAFDAKTGRLLWTTMLEANGHALPMTYRGRSGRQYVVIAAGGGGYFSHHVADTIDAFALPADATSPQE